MFLFVEKRNLDIPCELSARQLTWNFKPLFSHKINSKTPQYIGTATARTFSFDANLAIKKKTWPVHLNEDNCMENCHSWRYMYPK